MANQKGPMTNYPYGFMQGILIRGIPLTQTHPGLVFWVDNVNTAGGTVNLKNQKNSSDGNQGSFNDPFLTLQYAMTQCVAGRGDVIMIKPGYTETISAATGWVPKAGTAIIGLGMGTLRPTITLDTATSSTINVAAANVTFHNFIFVAGYAAIASLFTLTTAKDFTVQNSEFRDSGSFSFVSIVTTNTTSNAADGLTIQDCNGFLLGTTASSVMVNCPGTNERFTIKGNYYQNLCVTDQAKVLLVATGKSVKYLQMLDNIFNTAGVTSAAAGTIVVADTAGSGVIARNYIFNLDATSEILVTAAMGYRFFDNKSTAVADLSGYLLPAADA